MARQAKRHKAWVSRDDTCSKLASRQHGAAWRPKTQHRLKAKHIFADWDNQLRQSTPLPGLVYYKRNEHDDHWKNWRNWPHLGMSSDLGSDTLCACMAAIFKYELNFTLANDFDHGCQRIVVDSMRACNCYDFFLMMVCSWNLPNGPDDNDMRFHQILSAIQHCQWKLTARTCVPYLV